jgi:hypothetical protein
MSYLLQSEVDGQKQRDKYCELETKMDKLTVLVHNNQTRSATVPLKPQGKQFSYDSPAAGTPTHPPREDIPGTDRTTDLYAGSPRAFPMYGQHVHEQEQSQHTPASSYQQRSEEFAFSTPELAARPPSAYESTSSRVTSLSATKEPKQEVHVRFNLDPPPTPPPAHTAATPTYTTAPGTVSTATPPMRTSGQLGSSASDWLFAPSATLAASFGATPGSASASSYHHENSRPQTSSPAMHTSQHASSSSGGTPMQAQRQQQTPHEEEREPAQSTPGSARVLELQRQLAILRHDRNTAAAAGTPSSSTAAADPLRQFMRWESGASPASVSAGTNPVRVPHVSPSLASYVDEEDSVTSQTDDTSTASNRHRTTYTSGRRGPTPRDMHDLRVSQDEEGVSYSAIPSHLVPTPERAPRHPFGGSTSEERGAAATVPSFVRGYSYDARSGSYGY